MFDGAKVLQKSHICKNMQDFVVKDIIESTPFPAPAMCMSCPHAKYKFDRLGEFW